MHFGWLSTNAFIVFALVSCRRRPRKSGLGQCPNQLRYRRQPRGTSRPYSVTNRTTASSTLKWDPPGANTVIPPLQVRGRRSSTERARVATRSTTRARYDFVSCYRARRMGYLVVHQRTARTGNKRGQRADVHFRRGRRPGPGDTGQVPSVLHYRRSGRRIRLQDGRRTRGKKSCFAHDRRAEVLGFRA